MTVIQEPLLALQEYFENLNQQLEAVKDAMGNNPELKHSIASMERLDKLRLEFDQLVNLNQMVLEKKQESAGNAQNELMKLMGRIQALKNKHQLNGSPEYDQVTHTALSTLTDWKMELEGGSQ